MEPRNLLIFTYLLFYSFSFSQNGNETPKNVWLAIAQVKNMGNLSFYMLENRQANGETLLLSPADRDKKLFGGFKATLLRAVQKRKNDNSLSTIELKDSGEIHLLVMNMRLLNTKLISPDSVSGQIFSPDYQQFLGNFSAVKTDISEQNISQLADYENIVNKIEAITSKNIYNPALTETKNWKNFIDNFREKAAIVNDDLEFMLMFFMNAKNVGFSHFSMLKENVNLERIFKDNQLEYNNINDTVGLIKVKTLSGKLEEIDSVFEVCKDKNTLILDFRNMSGGLLKNAYLFSSKLITDTINGGNFITRHCYVDANCKNNSTFYENFPVVNNIDFQNFTNLIKQNEGVNIQIIPEKNNTKRKIYILTNSKTASAGEPLVYGLQANEVAKVVGEKTAGQILSPDVFDVGNGYFLVVPIAEYLAPDGNKIEGKGIVPNIKVKSEKALDLVLKLISN
jgi:carboxyl-terminal processing protease